MHSAQAPSSSRRSKRRALICADLLRTSRDVSAWSFPRRMQYAAAEVAT